jgi:hypothetical protein
MHKVLIALVAATSLASPACAQAPAKPLRPDAPKIVIALSIDQLSADLFDAYRPTFTGGLKRLAAGTVFRNGYQSHAATETCPGHSTLLTAWHPARNGIIGNSWIDQSVGRDDKTIYCAEDEQVAGSTSTAYTASPVHLRAKTLGELLKTVSPASRNVAVGGKDRSALMMGGHVVDQRWYWDGKTFETDRKGASVPAGIAAFKVALATAIGTARPPLDPPAHCAGKGKSYTLAPGLTVGDNRLGRAAGDVRAFRVSPDLDGATLVLSAALIAEMGLGRGAQTDLISIGLAATDYVGHSYGSDGMEMCLQLAALDRELGDFFARLDSAGIDYSVMMTADHGGMDIPERLRDQGVAGAARADKSLGFAEVGKLVGGRLGLTGTVLLGSGVGGEAWLSTALKPADRNRVLAAVLATYRASPQVHGAYSKSQIAAVKMPTGDPRGWSVTQRLRASFDPQRSGDVMVVLKQHISPISAPSAGYVAGHGTPWDYDRRVPIVFWRKGMTASERSDWADTVDIMPTLAAEMGVKLAPGTTDGRCLTTIQGITCPR